MADADPERDAQEEDDLREDALIGARWAEEEEDAQMEARWAESEDDLVAEPEPEPDEDEDANAGAGETEPVTVSTTPPKRTVKRGPAEKLRANTFYRPEYAGQAEKLCLLLGATDADLAAFFEVSERAIYRWKERHPFFAAALKRGKLVADGQVAESLFRQAKGHFPVKRVKVFADPKSGAQMQVEYEEEQLPNVQAAMFWLKNRQPAKWRDRQKVEVGNLDAMTDEQLAEIAAGRDPGPV